MVTVTSSGRVRVVVGGRVGSRWSRSWSRSRSGVGVAVVAAVVVVAVAVGVGVAVAVVVGVVVVMFTARQSLLRTHDACPLAASGNTTNVHRLDGPEAALGTVMHAVAAEILATLRRTGEVRVPTEEALVIAHEIQARPDMPHLAIEQRRTLRIMVLQFSKHQWDAARIVGIEQHLEADVVCPDGVTRRLTGRPDAMFADPPGGLIMLDLKTGWGKPPEPRDGNWLREDGRPFLSDRGTFQLDVYGYLALRNMPAVEQIVLREYFPRRDLLREAYLRREDLEHVERYIGIALQRLDGMLAGGIAAEPRPGAWCARSCPSPGDCPIPATLRRAGAVATPEVALDVARRYTVLDAARGRDNTALKAYLNDGPDAIDIGGAWVGWKEGKRSRSFGVHAVDPATTITEGDDAA